MTDIHDQLAAAADEVARLARGVDPTRLADPTPCPELDLGRLVLHLMQEVVLHGWDLAAATGQRAAFPDDVAASVLRHVRDDEDPLRRGDWYEPARQTSSDSLLDRAVAASGRDPAWSPTG